MSTLKKYRFGSELLKTHFFNRSETRTLKSAGVFGLPVEKIKTAVVGIKKEATYFFRMLAPFSVYVFGKDKKNKKAKTFFGVSPFFGGVSKKLDKNERFCFQLKKELMT